MLVPVLWFLSQYMELFKCFGNIPEFAGNLLIIAFVFIAPLLFAFIVAKHNKKIAKQELFSTNIAYIATITVLFLTILIKGIVFSRGNIQSLDVVLIMIIYDVYYVPLLVFYTIVPFIYYAKEEENKKETNHFFIIAIISVFVAIIVGFLINIIIGTAYRR